MTEQAKTAEELRADAQQMRERAVESFERCDTDGFLSQWADGINARLRDLQARIKEAGDKWHFPGLYDGKRRVAAREIEGQFGWQWLLRDDEAAKYGRKYLPTGPTSRIHKSLGLKERQEMAPAWAKLMGGGRGLSGAATCRPGAYRTGDKWGADAELIPMTPEPLIAFEGTSSYAEPGDSYYKKVRIMYPIGNGKHTTQKKFAAEVAEYLAEATE